MYRITKGTFVDVSNVDNLSVACTSSPLTQNPRGLIPQIRTGIVLSCPFRPHGYRDYPDRGLGRDAGLLAGAHEKGEGHGAVLEARRGAHIRAGGVRVV